MHKALLPLLLAVALAGCSAGDLVSPGQAPTANPASTQPPAVQAPASPTPAPQSPATPPAGGAAQTQPAPQPVQQPPQPAPQPFPSAAQPGSPTLISPGGGVRFNTYGFSQVSPQDLKEPARSWLLTHHDDPAFAIFRDGKDTYLLAAIGQRNTGGYSVSISSVGGSNGQIEVVVQEQRPRPGQMVTQVITWPVAAAKIADLPDQPVHFVLTSSTGGGAQTYEATVLQ